MPERPEVWDQNKEGVTITQEELDQQAVEGALHLVLKSTEPNAEGNFPLKGGGFITPEDVGVWLNIPKTVHDRVHPQAFRTARAVRKGRIDHKAIFLIELGMLKTLIEFSSKEEPASTE